MPLARVVIAALALALAGCGGGEPPPRAARPVVKQAAWQDAFDGTPEVLGVVRPKALIRDGVYGNLFKTLVRASIAKSALRGTSAMEIVESCDELVFGLVTTPETGRPSGALVLSGVAAAHDPAKLVDEAGQPLFRIRDERATIPEYAPVSGAAGALFVLPGRTWVVTEGAMSARARQAFSAPAGRPRPVVDETALFAVRVGPEIVTAPRYAKSQLFGPVVRRLDSATVALEPDAKGVRLVLKYTDGDAAAYGEMQLKRVLSAIVESDPKKFAWLGAALMEATGSRSGETVTVRYPVPPQLLEDLSKGLPPGLLGL